METLNQCVYRLPKQTDSLFIAGPVNTPFFKTYIYDYCYADIDNASYHCKLIFMTCIDIEILFYTDDHVMHLVKTRDDMVSINCAFSPILYMQYAQ